MSAQLRLILLALTLAYCTLWGPGQALAGSDRHHGIPRPRPQRPRLHRSHAPRLAAPQALGVRAVQFARRLLGIPYRWGGDSPSSGFDCSGLVRYVYAHFGLSLPHSSYADFGLGTRVSRGALRPGDLVFFDGVGHVGMYVGGGRFIHAPHTGTTVQVTSLSEPWYRAAYDGARRLFRPRPTPRRSELKPRRAELKPRRAELKPRRAELKPRRAELKPRRAELKPRRAEAKQLLREALRAVRIRLPHLQGF